MEGEVRRLLDGAHEAYGPAFERLLRFMAWCPRRPVAIFAIRRAHCSRIIDRRYKRNDKQVFVERDKGGYGRGWCPLTEPALLALTEQLQTLPDEPQALVWPAPEGGRYESSHLNPRVDRAAELAGLLDVQPYDVRKFGASQVYATTRDVKQTQAYTGHKEPMTLIRRYLFDVPGLADTAAATITWSAPQLQLVAGAEED